MPRHPFAYPWEWLESITTVGCPECGLSTPPLRPSRRRSLTCRGCRTRFNSFTGKVAEVGPPPRVLRSMEQVLHELHAAAGAARTEPGPWLELLGNLRLLLERTPEQLPICRSLLDHEALPPATVAERLADATDEVRAAIGRQAR